LDVSVQFVEETVDEVLLGLGRVALWEEEGVVEAGAWDELLVFLFEEELLDYVLGAEGALLGGLLGWGAGGGLMLVVLVVVGLFGKGEEVGVELGVRGGQVVF
jgi:hypothetical protein